MAAKRLTRTFRSDIRNFASRDYGERGASAHWHVSNQRLDVTVKIAASAGAPSTPSTEPTESAPSGSRTIRTTSARQLREYARLPPARTAATESPTGHRRHASLPAVLPAGPAPALHEMIGNERAGALDAKFGSLQPPRNLSIDGIKPWEREGGAEDGKPLTHPNRVFVPDSKGQFARPESAQLKNALDLDALKRGEKKYMWTVSALGRLIVGEESQTETSGERTLGHPTLVGGWNARISGELRYNTETGKFVVSNRSGRYSRYADRSLAALDAVIGMFAQMGLSVERDLVEKYMTRKKPEPLVLASLDPGRRPGPSR